MAEHIITDSDTRFVLDPITRKLTTVSLKKVMAQGDHRSEVITFELPRYIEGHDMSLCTSAQVHFTNTEGKQPKRTCSDVWEASDLTLDGDKVTFSWLVENTATKYAGSLAFSIKLQCLAVGEDGVVIKYEYNSAEYTKISIIKAQDNISEAVEESTSLLSSFKEQVIADTEDALRASMEGYISQAQNAAQDAADSAAQASAIVGLTVDTALSDTSINPVQNKAVKAAIDNAKEDMQSAIGTTLLNQKGVAGGVASLEADGKVPRTQLPAMDYVPTSQKGNANGVATLGGDGKVPQAQLPAMDYIPVNQKNAAGGVAGLDANGKLSESQLPTSKTIELLWSVTADGSGEYGISGDLSGSTLNLAEAYITLDNVVMASNNGGFSIRFKAYHGSDVKPLTLSFLPSSLQQSGYYRVVGVNGIYREEAHMAMAENISGMPPIYENSGGITQLSVEAIGTVFSSGTIKFYGVRA